VAPEIERFRPMTRLQMALFGAKWRIKSRNRVSSLVVWQTI
jgi:hypothetical protein